MSAKTETARIPTNLITGFLGSGKTTSILHLVQQKPVDEVWGILVNEFGQIGIDGDILSTSQTKVVQVAGGCLCCAAGPVFDVTLNRLIQEIRPDRILIEPTGIGHPKQIIHKLTHSPHINTLDLKAMICLLDPRHLNQPRYTEHEIFRDQVALADILIANKTDLCSEDTMDQYQSFANKLLPKKPIIMTTEHGRIDICLLDIDATHHPKNPAQTFSIPKQTQQQDSLFKQPPPVGWSRKENQADQFFSCSWTAPHAVQFELSRLVDWSKQHSFERFKAIVHTSDGWMLLNGTPGSMSTMATNAASLSRLEVILSSIPTPDMESGLMQCILTQDHKPQPGVRRDQRLGTEGLKRLRRQLKSGTNISNIVLAQWVRRYGEEVRALLIEFGHNPDDLN